MTPLQQLAQLYIANGWRIDSISSEQAVFSKQDQMSDAWITAGVIGLFFGLVPGIGILIIGYLGRKTHRRIVTAEQAPMVLSRVLGGSSQ